MNEQPTMPHQWTNGGDEVLILKCANRDGTSRNGFKWPLTVGATVEAPDWNPAPICGGGLHGWPWGLSLGDGQEPIWSGAWLVFGSAAKDVVDLAGKCKAHKGTVRFVGSWNEAMLFILSGQMAWVAYSASGAASATGESGAASATGWSGAASATGGSGAASATGQRGAASATGWRGAASATGGRGAASATGWSGAASATGASSVAAVTGTNGRAKAGPFGCICLAWWNDAEGRSEMKCATTGEGRQLKENVWYRLDTQGNFVEDPEGD